MVLILQLVFTLATDNVSEVLCTLYFADLAGKSLEDQARVNQIMLDTEDFQLPAVNLFFVDDEKTKVCFPLILINFQ